MLIPLSAIVTLNVYRHTLDTQKAIPQNPAPQGFVNPFPVKSLPRMVQQQLRQHHLIVHHQDFITHFITSYFFSS